MKNLLILSAAICCLTATATGARAQNLIYNGNFELGDVGFTSDYTYVAPNSPSPVTNNPSPLWDPGTYSVGTNPNLFHSLWASFGDHTTGSGNMLLVNGASSDVAVWQGTLNQGQSLVAGQQYQFSAWLANVYPPPTSPGTTPTAPAELQFSINGNMIGSGAVSATGVGNWTEFSATFTATSVQSGVAVMDLETAYSGNDFALDDISLTATPEPSAWALGFVALIAFSFLHFRRRNIAVK